MSLTCFLYTIRPVRRIRDRCGGLEGRKADAVMRARATNLEEGHQDSRMYDDMRRIRTEALLSYVKERNGTCVGLTA